MPVGGQIKICGGIVLFKRITHDVTFGRYMLQTMICYEHAIFGCATDFCISSGIWLGGERVGRYLFCFTQSSNWWIEVLQDVRNSLEKVA